MNMKISDLGEFGLIERIRRTAPRNAKRAPIGIGDDAAALLFSPSATLLATTDMLIEGVHFDLKTTDLYSLGWKAAAVNLSDIAAMGGVPRFCLTALGIPSSLAVGKLDEFYRGFAACIRKQGTVLVGGDTCSSRKGLIISVTVLGEVEKKHIITRAGARPGDLLFVTGTLGDSGAGLELLRSAECGVRNRKPECRKLIEKHLKPIPRVAEGRKLALSGLASAMIDVSDGLSSDLGHICEQSEVGAEIFSDRIPLSNELRSTKGLKRPALEYALSGGEDYELLFTVPPRKIKKLKTLQIAATEIGIITLDRSMRLIDERGQGRTLTATGYDHFRSGRQRGSVR
jgi:thiamine-monophosphate kinase